MLLAFGFAGTGRMEQALARARHATELRRGDQIRNWCVKKGQGQSQAWTRDRDDAIENLAYHASARPEVEGYQVLERDVSFWVSSCVQFGRPDADVASAGVVGPSSSR